MIRISKLGLCSVIVGALALSGSLAQAQMNVDPALAKRGQKVFVNRGCNACHTVGKAGKMAGPDLAGVTVRRSEDWLKRWLKDPTAFYGADSIADAMVVEYKNVKMPNLKLSDSEISAITNYLAEHPTPVMKK
jgi:cbb3-type cytochrome oxidase cytochrome c subunit